MDRQVGGWVGQCVCVWGGGDMVVLGASRVGQPEAATIGMSTAGDRISGTRTGVWCDRDPTGVEGARWG
jgi:hypothetical protein